LHEEVAHRRIDVLIRAPHVVSAAFQERGKRGHRRATDANQMYSLGVHAVTAASSMMSAGRGEGRTRPRTPNGSVNVGPAVWPDGRPNRIGPRKPRVSSSTTSRAVGVPPGSLQRGSSPNTSADARDRIPLKYSWVSIRSSL